MTRSTTSTALALLILMGSASAVSGQPVSGPVGSISGNWLVVDRKDPPQRQAIRMKPASKRTPLHLDVAAAVKAAALPPEPAVIRRTPVPAPSPRTTRIPPQLLVDHVDLNLTGSSGGTRVATTIAATKVLGLDMKATAGTSMPGLASIGDKAAPWQKAPDVKLQMKRGF